MHLLHSLNRTASFVADPLVFGADAALYIYRCASQNLLVIFGLGFDGFHYRLRCRSLALQHNTAWSSGVTLLR